MSRGKLLALLIAGMAVVIALSRFYLGNDPTPQPSGHGRPEVASSAREGDEQKGTPEPALPTVVVPKGPEIADTELPKPDPDGRNWDRASRQRGLSGRLEFRFVNSKMEPVVIQKFKIRKLRRKGEKQCMQHWPTGFFAGGENKGGTWMHVPLRRAEDKYRGLLFGRRYLVISFLKAPMGNDLFPKAHMHPKFGMGWSDFPGAGYSIIEIPESIPEGKMVRQYIDVGYRDPLFKTPEDTRQRLTIRFPQDTVRLVALPFRYFEVKGPSPLSVLVPQDRLEKEVIVFHKGRRHAWLYRTKLGKTELDFPKDADVIFNEKDFVQYRVKVPKDLAKDASSLGILYDADDSYALISSSLKTFERVPKDVVELSTVPGERYVGYFGENNRMNAIGTIKLPKIYNDELLEISPLLKK